MDRCPRPESLCRESGSVEDAKQEMTRERRIRRTREELEEGQRRLWRWPGLQAPRAHWQVVGGGSAITPAQNDVGSS
jgi:hypothetical protein